MRNGAPLFSFDGYRRITSSGNYLPEIDGLRFLAISSVFVFHLAGDILRHSAPRYHETLQANHLFWLTQRMNFGVQLFFVVSGFVLALPFASQYLKGQKPVSLKKYLLRRVTRLEPPYIVALILFFILKLVGARGGFADLLPHLGASLVYLHNVIFGRPSEINFVAWSLEIEVQFYLLAPLISALAFRSPHPARRRVAMLLASLLSVVLVSGLHFSPRTDLSILGQFPYFLAGFLLADLYTEEAGSFRGSLAGDAGFLVACSVLVMILDNGPLLACVGPFVVLSGYYAAFHSILVRRFLSTTFVCTVGGMCYSIYLLHNYIMALCGMFTERFTAHLPFDARLAIQFVLIGPPVLVISALYFKLIERPCMRPDWPARLTRWFFDKLATVFPIPAPFNAVVAGSGSRGDSKGSSSATIQSGL